MRNNFNIQEVRDFWDKVAEIYEPLNKNVGYVHTQRFEKTLLYSNLKPGLTILNIWSRTGNLIPHLRQTEDLKIINREASPKMMAIAMRKFPYEDFKLTDLEHLGEFPDNTFDRIISLETLEHAPNPTEFLKELRRVLKPGGLLVMSLPPRGSEVPEFFYNLIFKDHGEGPHQYLWSWEVKNLLKEAGFKLQKHKPFIILPFGSDKFKRRSEKLLSAIFGHTPIGQFGYRHFYICTK